MNLEKRRTPLSFGVNFTSYYPIQFLSYFFIKIWKNKFLLNYILNIVQQSCNPGRKDYKTHIENDLEDPQEKEELETRIAISALRNPSINGAR